MSRRSDKLTFAKQKIYENETPRDVPDEVRREIARQIARDGFAMVRFRGSDPSVNR
nr:hypothetical protein [uncultured Butyrivibrio sp.]